MFFAGVIHQRWLRGLLISTLAALLLSSCGGGGQQEDQAAEEQAPEAALDAAFEKAFEESDAPGVVAAVQTPEYTWVRALGVADRTSQEPMTPDVHHRIGSVTKTFTISLLLQAADEGLLFLDDTIDQYYEGVPNGDSITLRQMATMRSGIADFATNEQWLEEISSHPRRIWTPEEVVQLGIEDSPLFDPGTDYHYSNVNTILLGLVLEQVTGESIGQLYRERIIEPLGLQGTSFPDAADNSLPELHAQGYTFFLQSSGGEEPIDATDWNVSYTWTAGAMISTVEDLLVYGRALGTGERLLPPERQAERLDSLLQTDKPETAYGLGLEGSGGWIGHQGLIPGFTTALFYHPDLDAVVAVEVNADYLSGDCPEEVPTMTNGVQGVPCDIPSEPIFAALGGALGKPFPLTHQVLPES